LLIGVFLIWSLFSTLGALIWVTGDLSFWLPVTMLWWVLIISAFEMRVTEGSALAGQSIIAPLCMLSIVAAVAACNFFAVIGPHMVATAP